MATQPLTLDLPAELIALMGSPDAAAAKAKESLVLELLREAQISQGTAARHGLLVRIEVRTEFTLGNEAAGLAIDGLQRAGVQLMMSRDGQRLPATCLGYAPKLDMAAALTDRCKAKAGKDGNHPVT